MRALVLALAACCSAGCVCTDAYCSDEVRLEISSTPGALPLGNWAFTVQTPAGRWEVTCALDASGAECQSPAPDRVEVIRLSDATWQVSIYGLPSTVTLEAVLDGTAIGSHSFQPVYGDPYRPNGPGCGPECRVATETWTLAESTP